MKQTQENIFQSKRLIATKVEVQFAEPQLHKKRPVYPSAFVWNGEKHQICQILSEWQNFSRRGRLSQNMQFEHLMRASKKGSWGVGRYYFRVKTVSGQIFDLYYDRAPRRVDDRLGSWILYQELVQPGQDCK